MSDDAVLVVGLDDEPPPPPPPPRRIGWAALAVVAGLAIWLGGSFDLGPPPTDEPAPLPVAEPPPDPTGGRTWVEVDGGGDGIVDAGGPVLLGTRSWDPDGGSWRLLVGDEVLDVGNLPRNPVATVDDDGMIRLVGRSGESLALAAIDPTDGRRGDDDVVPEPGRRPPEAVAVAGESVFVDAGDRIWARPAPGDPWAVHELVSAVVVTGDGVFGLAPSYERVLVYRWDGVAAFEPVGTIEMEDEHPAAVTSTWGPGWAFVEACRGSDCRRFARPDGGAWGTAPDLPALPRWNGERWWSASVFALRSRPPIMVSDDGVVWEELPMPRFWLGADEQARAVVLPDDRLLIALLRPNGSSTVLVGESG